MTVANLSGPPDGLLPAVPVDVVIPAWGKYVASLPRAIASARDAASVIAVVDAGQEAAALAAGATVVVTRSEGMKTGSARNAGAARGTEPFVLFLDADDTLLPGALRSLHGLLASDPQAVMAFGSFRGSDGRCWPPVRRSRLMEGRFALPLLMSENTLPATAALIRRAALPAGLLDRLFPDVIHEDWVAAVKLRAAGPVRFLDQDVLAYSVYEGSKSRSPIDPAEKARCHHLLRQALNAATRLAPIIDAVPQQRRRQRLRRLPQPAV